MSNGCGLKGFAKGCEPQELSPGIRGLLSVSEMFLKRCIYLLWDVSPCEVEEGVNVKECLCRCVMGCALRRASH